MLDSGLVVLQTTNDILNASLYELLDHRTVVSWQRVCKCSDVQGLLPLLALLTGLGSLPFCI